MSENVTSTAARSLLAEVVRERSRTLAPALAAAMAFYVTMIRPLGVRTTLATELLT